MDYGGGADKRKQGRRPLLIQGWARRRFLCSSQRGAVLINTGARAVRAKRQAARASALNGGRKAEGTPMMIDPDLVAMAVAVVVVLLPAVGVSAYHRIRARRAPSRR